MACLSRNTQRYQTYEAFFLCRTHAALKDRLPAPWACGLIKSPRQDDWQLFLSPPPPPHPIPSLHLRFEESALQASRRCAEECQETLWWSEPAADEQRRSGHVTREQCMCWEGIWRRWGCVREGETGGLKDDKWKMTSVATIEMSMYIYYIWIHVIPCLWYSSSFSRWRTGTCVGLNFKCLKGWLRNLRQAKCLNLYCLSDDCF